MSDFDDQISLAHQSDAQVADFLEHFGDAEGARELREAGARGQGLGDLLARPWRSSTHLFGFIEEGAVGEGPIPIVPATSIEADVSLVGQRVKVTLDAFQVHKYPGTGVHKVLFDFQGRDQAGKESQDLQFASVLHVSDGANAAVSGVPIFTGVTVPGDGLSFKARTVLIGNAGDEAIIDVLESSVFKDGLKLLSVIQPALPQLVALSGGITKNLIKREWNKQVQMFDLGLDFSRSSTSARLRRGSYVVVQVPGENMWRWSDWRFDRDKLAVVDSDGVKTKHNVVVFAVSASTSTKAASADRAEGRAAAKAGS